MAAADVSAPERLSGLVPPQNLEAEESVLGAMLLSPTAVGTVSEIVDASHFYRESHAKIYRAALALWAKGEPVDPAFTSNRRTVFESTSAISFACSAVRASCVARCASTRRSSETRADVAVSASRRGSR